MGINMADAKEMLAQVDNAITNILVGGQSYRIGSRQLTRADLATLQGIKNDLAAQVAQEGNNGLLSDTYVAFFEGR